ncbi:hypothetical protein OH76DRAFT_1407198 [Lentinus brumalis]|uniref:Uncharacterized protein n=1 Tax=Lentinus brumalis TaxID=2498619 RepID=A0A371D1D0_9APHY|nr:hypothetical protein OH76DRAFT_1407198 [Polyporus brumalis]
MLQAGGAICDRMPTKTKTVTREGGATDDEPWGRATSPSAFIARQPAFARFEHESRSYARVHLCSRTPIRRRRSGPGRETTVSLSAASPGRYSPPTARLQVHAAATRSTHACPSALLPPGSSLAVRARRSHSSDPSLKPQVSSLREHVPPPGDGRGAVVSLDLTGGDQHVRLAADTEPSGSRAATRDAWPPPDRLPVTDSESRTWMRPDSHVAAVLLSSRAPCDGTRARAPEDAESSRHPPHARRPACMSRSSHISARRSPRCGEAQSPDPCTAVAHASRLEARVTSMHRETGCLRDSPVARENIRCRRLALHSSGGHPTLVSPAIVARHQRTARPTSTSDASSRARRPGDRTSTADVSRALHHHRAAPSLNSEHRTNGRSM